MALALLAAVAAPGAARAQDAAPAPPAGTGAGEGRGASAGAAGGTTADDEEYRTPLAGRRFETTVLGEPVVIEARDRSRITALSLGAQWLEINGGETDTTPIFSVFTKLLLEGRRVRAVVSGLVNTIDVAQDLGWGESLVHFENNTIPFATKEVIDGRARRETALLWGDLSAWVGLGYRWRVGPGEVDNGLRVGAYYHVGWEYHQRVDETPPDERVATDTMRHGVRLQLRCDALLRNVLELPHRGVAFGGDVELTRRDRWRDHGDLVSRRVDKDDTRDYLKLSGYFVLACGLPWLSERHRLVAQVHGGWAKHDTVDRFSAFRLGGGPIPTEAADLARAPFPGAGFNQVPIEDYLYVTAEYRLEVLFFLYLHLRATVGLAKAPTFEDGPGRLLRFRRREGYALTAAVSTGAPFESMLYVEYDYDVNGGLRGGNGGNTVLVLWSKSF